MTDRDSPPPARPGRLRLGCGLLAVLLVAVPVATWQWSAHRAAIRHQAAVQAHAKKANDAFEPAMQALNQGVQAARAAPDYDIDKTIRVIHQIDLALKQDKDLPSYLQTVAVQDYSGVAPDVLSSRAKLMDILLRLYAKQVESKDQQAMWEFTSELLLSTFSVVQVSGDASVSSPSASFSIDRAKAQELLSDLKAQQADRKQLQRDITSLQKQLTEALFEYSDTYYKYVREWDALSVLRDRAYLAAHNGDWDQVIKSSELAIEKAPHEREAHLLLAMALIQKDQPEDDDRVEKLLSDYIDAHPDATAPAFLLLGVHQERRHHLEAARLSFQQAAAYYPKQSEALSDMLDPYKMRAFLRKSREGTFIVELYKSTMLGAGYFSPDLQMAKMLYDEGKDDQARTKVLDHFARRRAQKQWDFILSDLQFCNDLLGPKFWEIFPENTYLDLEVHPTLLGSGLDLGVRNRSARTLHDATLVLVLHFTDTYAGDYRTLAAQTQPAVLAHDTTSFGSVDVKVDVNGVTKGVDDIVTDRAILVSSEAVTWVDTDKYKIAESKEFREKRQDAKISDRELPSPVAEQHPEFHATVERIVKDVSSKATMQVEPKYGNDNVLVHLPRELAVLRPLFRLYVGDQEFTAADNEIDGDQITLRFKSVENWDDKTSPPTDDLKLVASSPFGDLTLTWTPAGDLTWHFDPLWSP